MKILVVHEVSYRKKVVYEYQDFAERLAGLGNEVTVVDYDDTGDHKYRKEVVSRTGTGQVTLENTPYLNLPIVKYLSGRRNYHALLKTKLERREVDVVLLYSVFINGTNTVRLCKKFGVPVVYRVLDVYHKLRQNRLIEWPLYFGEKYIYQNADVLCVTNEKLGGYVQQLAGARRAVNLQTLHHGVDTTHFRPCDRLDALREHYGITAGTKVLLYLGTTYEFSGLDRLIVFLPKLKASCGLVKLIIVGGGVLDPTLKALAQAPECRGEVILTGFKGYEDLPALVSLADLCLNPFALNTITRDIVPIKILQYLACGRAALSSPLPEVTRLFPEGVSGVTYAAVEPFEAYVEAIVGLLRNDERRAALADQGLSYVTERFSVEVQINKLSRLLATARASRTPARGFAKGLAREAGQGVVP